MASGHDPSPQLPSEQTHGPVPPPPTLSRSPTPTMPTSTGLMLDTCSTSVGIPSEGTEQADIPITNGIPLQEERPSSVVIGDANNVRGQASNPDMVSDGRQTGGLVESDGPQTPTQMHLSVLTDMPVAETPISALLTSIQRGFLFMPSSPLPQLAPSSLISPDNPNTSPPNPDMTESLSCLERAAGDMDTQGGESGCLQVQPLQIHNA